jgi:hypothetical protein
MIDKPYYISEIRYVMSVKLFASAVATMIASGNLILYFCLISIALATMSVLGLNPN